MMVMLSLSASLVSVVLGVHSHGVLNNVVKLLHPGLNNNLGSFYSLLGTNDGDALPVSIISPREDDPGSSFVSDFLDVNSSPSNQELVVLWLGFHLHTNSTQLLLITQFLEEFDSLLNIINRSANCHQVGSRTILRELDSNPSTF